MVVKMKDLELTAPIIRNGVQLLLAQRAVMLFRDPSAWYHIVQVGYHSRHGY